MPKSCALKASEFYCVACQKRVNVKPGDIRVSKDVNNRPRLVAYDRYDHKLFKYIKQADEKKLRNKYN
jgi:hypothetical protein